MLGVVGSVELASDREDSDCRATAGVVRAAPWEVVVVCEEGCEAWGSSSVARDGLPPSSLNDLRRVLLPRARPGPDVALGSGRGMSWERRNLLARFIREGFFLGPVMSFVGAVVMISGAGERWQSALNIESWAGRGSDRCPAHTSVGHGRRLLGLLLCSHGELRVRRIAEAQYGEALVLVRYF